MKPKPKKHKCKDGSSESVHYDWNNGMETHTVEMRLPLVASKVMSSFTIIPDAPKSLIDYHYKEARYRLVKAARRLYFRKTRELQKELSKR